MQAKFRVDTGSTLRVLLESGAGIAALDSLSSAEPLKAGRLQRVLTRWSLPDGGIYAAYPPGKHIANTTRAFVDF